MSSLGSAWAICGLSQTSKRMHANSVDLCLIGSDRSEPQEVVSSPHFFYSIHQLELTRKHCSWSVVFIVPTWIWRRMGVSGFTCGDQRKTRKGALLPPWKPRRGFRSGFPAGSFTWWATLLARLLFLRIPEKEGRNGLIWWKAQPEKDCNCPSVLLSHISLLSISGGDLHR